MKRWVSVLLVAVLSAPVAGWSQAVYPSKTVRMVVPLPPGGSNDVVARILAEHMSKSWGQPVVVENKPGANTIIGVNTVLSNPPDGHTLLIGVTSTYTMNPLVDPKLSYDPVRDLMPVTMLADHPDVIAVNPNVPARTLEELIALAKREPGKLNYGTPAVTFQVVVEGFSQKVGIEMMHIPFKGSGPTVEALIAGEIQVAFLDPPAVVSNIRAGRVRALAVSSTQRVSYLPDVPTVDEAGVPGYQATMWVGLFVRAGTAPEIVAKLHKDAAEILRMPAVSKRLESVGLTAVANSPSEFAAYLKEESSRYAPVVKAANIRTR